MQENDRTLVYGWPVPGLEHRAGRAAVELLQQVEVPLLRVHQLQRALRVHPGAREAARRLLLRQTQGGRWRPMTGAVAIAYRSTLIWV